MHRPSASGGRADMQLQRSKVRSDPKQKSPARRYAQARSVPSRHVRYLAGRSATSRRSPRGPLGFWIGNRTGHGSSIDFSANLPLAPSGAASSSSMWGSFWRKAAVEQMPNSSTLCCPAAPDTYCRHVAICWAARPRAKRAFQYGSCWRKAALKYSRSIYRLQNFIRLSD